MRLARLSLALVPVACGGETAAEGDAGESSGSTGTAETTTSETTAVDSTESSTGSSSSSTTGDASSSSSSSSTGEAPACCGCLCLDDHWSCAEDTCLGEDGTVLALAPEAGFFEIDSGDYVTGFATLTSPRHRVWYAFHPADDAPEDKPLLLFFNGGPGSSTGPLFGFNTGPYTFDPAVAMGAPMTVTAAPWTSFGNLLWVDAPGTGFSYPLALEGGEQPPIEIDADRDAAAFIRVLLRFLARHPQIRDNPVVIVGESYGGTRSTLILRHLLRYDELVDGEYRDVELYDEIVAHYDAVFGQGEGVAPDQIAQQFGTQALIQPLVGGNVQFAYAFPQPTPAYCVPSPDQYQCDEPDGWTFGMIDLVAEALVDLDSLQTALGVDPTTIAWMHAEQRTGAYSRGADGAPETEMTAAFGQLGLDDAYYVGFNWTVYGQLPGSRDWLGDDMGAQFLWNAGHVRTFITDAPYDLTVWSLGLPPALSYWMSIVSSVVHDTAPQPGVDRPGWIDLTYVPGAVEGVGDVEIRYPRYPTSGHIVTLKEPANLLADLAEWYASP
jgi:hypothetical protein